MAFISARKMIILPLGILLLTYAMMLSAMADVKSLFEQGMEAFNSGNYGSSELLFKRIVDSGDSEYSDRAWFFLARSIYSMKKYKSAIFEFESFLNKCRTPSIATESRFWMGESYLNLEEYSNAIEEYRRYISKGIDKNQIAIAHDRIGRIYFIQKRFDESIIEWETALSKSNDRIKNEFRIYRIGNAYFMNGKFDESYEKLKMLLSHGTDIKIVSMARIVTGQIYQHRNQHQQALAILNGISRNLLKEKPFNDAQFFMAKSYISLGNLAKAKSLLDLFLVIGKDSDWYYDAQYELGKILLQGETRDEGLKLLTMVKDEAGKDTLRALASLEIGTFYLEANPEKAIPYIEESLSGMDQVHIKDTSILLGKTYLKLRDFKKAGRSFDIYLEKYPFDPKRDEVKFLRARVYLETGDINKAIEIFEDIKKENPFSKYNNESIYHLALIKYSKDDLKEAISLLNKYILHKKGDNIFDAHLLLVELLIKSGDLVSAGKTVDVLIEKYINRNDVETALYNYARALQAKGKLPESKRYINLILTRFPQSETAMEIYFEYGNDNFNNKAYESAINYYNKYLNGQYSRHRGTSFYKRLEALYHLQRYEELIEIIEKKEFPPMNEIQWKEIPLLQARAYYKLGKYSEVYMVLDMQSLNQYQGDDILMYIESALAIGDTRTAMEASEILTKEIELYARALYLIGEFFIEKNNIEEAELFFDKIINECPDTGYLNRARLSMARIRVLNKEYDRAFSLIELIKDESIKHEKITMAAIIYFLTGREDEGVALTAENIGSIMKSDHATELLKYNMEYHFKKKDVLNFNKYAYYMGRLNSDNDYLNHMTGKIYYATGNYSKSYQYFARLSNSTSIYRDEAVYYLACYELFIRKSKINAIRHFYNVYVSEKSNSKIRLQSMVNLAIIFRELNDREKSNHYISELLKTSTVGLIFIQAKNLAEINEIKN